MNVFKRQRIFIIILLNIVFSLCLQAQEVLDGIVAVVNDDIILRTELLQKTLEPAIQMGINPMNQPDAFRKLQKDVLEYLIQERVLMAKAEEDTITADDAQVEAELEGRISALIQQAGSKEKLEASFGSSLHKIKKDLREEVRKYLIVQTIQQQKVSTIQISRPEVERFYATMKDSLPEKKAQVKLRHILMSAKAGGEAREQAVARIREIQQRLRNGEDFETLAKNYSEDPGTAGRGGSLGFIERGTLFEAFEDVAFDLEPGTVSDVVETPVGLHLIRVDEKRNSEINVRHILIRLTVTNEDEKGIEGELLKLRERIINGEDFAKLASEFSDDETTKAEGGDLGWNSIEDLQIEAFKNAVDTLEVGETTYPFETQWGYHIVKMEDSRPASTLSLEEDWEQIKQWALNMKKQRIFTEWIDELKKDMYIHINEDLL